jgi:DNA-binding protein H-NS
MGRYLELKAEKERIEREMEEARKAELDAIIGNMRTRISEYSLTPQDLFPGIRLSDVTIRSVRSRAEPKYRDPASGKTWSGRGNMPVWLVDFVKGGGDIETMRI